MITIPAHLEKMLENLSLSELLCFNEITRGIMEAAKERRSYRMFDLVLHSAKDVTDSVEIHFRLDRLDDGCTWTYKPISWRLSDSRWRNIVDAPVMKRAEIMAVEQATGYKMEQLGEKINTLDWIYTFSRN